MGITHLFLALIMANREAIPDLHLASILAPDTQ